MHFCPRDVWWIRNSYGSGSVHRDIAIKRAAHRHFLQTTFENTCYALNFASINHNRRSAYIYIYISLKNFESRLKNFVEFLIIFLSSLSLNIYICNGNSIIFQFQLNRIVCSPTSYSTWQRFWHVICFSLEFEWESNERYDDFEISSLMMEYVFVWNKNRRSILDP